MAVGKFEIADPLRTQAILAEHQIQAKKSLGQNFLKEPAVIDQIVADAQLTANDIVLEIGPGIGSLTEQLAKVAKQVYAFELDQSLIALLEENLAPYDNIQIIQGDFLEVDLAAFFEQKQLTGQSVKVVANLPYYITTPILLKLLNAPVALDKLILMMQKEVALRLTAQPGHREYGSLSVVVQTKSQVKIEQTVSHASFVPQPQVDSAVVSFDLAQLPDFAITDRSWFDQVVKAIFKQKRKNLWNNLLSFVGKNPENKAKLETVFQKLRWQHQVRAEQLSIEQINTLAQQLALIFPK
ncbi:16S rRNA (adenine(1518)-N(6)/adenine(1519)-N(6))-dimethyltransferase RsmA [Bombilactobacillus folatiphilus]|uniref:Ribosomal RNA small subunit methyltransferase A n=1 Tax=Bombilactobacillus folatiphilus TaxID=2923362 RepID=A0ABY4P9L1_9LACO|nr:16S rRNA (adenine(1518)-N(6)/adenine(1519)-N(6))-dimethyltransferase RsmA [Bombilactobacillus folatiphilus]UQS82305.1 16S rRNA (adenine(1518)-N(6)/adenine(1519)-N(6))-dimethyltransferase RsmA [Bombilactobacillus folatiphilus]